MLDDDLADRILGRDADPRHGIDTPLVQVVRDRGIFSDAALRQSITDTLAIVPADKHGALIGAVTQDGFKVSIAGRLGNGWELGTFISWDQPDGWTAGAGVIKTFLWVILCWLAATSTVQAQERSRWDPTFAAITPAYFLTVGADMRLTYDCLQAQLCVEQGPVVKTLVADHGPATGVIIRGAIGAGLWTGLLVAQHRLPQRYKFGPVVALATMTVVNGVVWAHNARELRKVGLR